MAEKKIRDIMTKNLVGVPSNAPVSQAISAMAQNNISCVVITEQTKPVGIITERDLVKRLLAAKKNPAKVKCSAVMTPHLITVSAESTLSDAMEVIEGMHIRRLPVADRTGIVGLVTLSDIVREAQSIHQHNQKLNFHQTIQSYIIIALTVLFVLISVLKIFVFK